MRKNEENKVVKVTLLSLVVSAAIILTIIWAFCHFGLWYLSFLMYWEVKEWLHYADIFVQRND